MTHDARPAPGRRRRLAPEVRQRQVLDAAVTVFSELGFHEASMDAVAAAAGVSKPMVYAHGGTKEELFARCLHREGERLLRTVTQAVGTGGDGERDPEARLWLGLRAFFRAVTTRRSGWTVLYRQAATGPFAGEIATMRARIVAQVATMIAEDLNDAGGRSTIGHGPVDPGVVAPLAYTLVGAAEGLADWWLEHADDASGSHDPEPADMLASTAMSVLWPGIGALREGRVWEPPIALSRRVSTEP